jgi:glutamine amidotransferase
VPTLPGGEGGEVTPRADGRRVIVIDVGIGNVGSLGQAFARLQHTTLLLTEPSQVAADDVLVLPGVGAAAPVAERLRSLGWDEVLRRWAKENRPLLGICLGMQLFFGVSEEGGRGLELLPGRVVALPPGLPLPHMGWNTVRARRRGDALFPEGVPDQYYFAHSFVVAPDDPDTVVATTLYGVEFPAAVRRGAMVGVQFHPEKSAEAGQRFLERLWEVWAWSASQPSTSSVGLSSASGKAASTR